MAAWSAPTAVVAVATPRAAASTVYPGGFIALMSPAPRVGRQTLTFVVTNPEKGPTVPIEFSVGVNHVSTVTGLQSPYLWRQNSSWAVSTDIFTVASGEVLEFTVAADLQYTDTYQGRLQADLLIADSREGYIQRLLFRYP